MCSIKIALDSALQDIGTLIVHEFENAGSQDTVNKLITGSSCSPVPHTTSFLVDRSRSRTTKWCQERNTLPFGKGSYNELGKYSECLVSCLPIYLYFLIWDLVTIGVV